MNPSQAIANSVSKLLLAQVFNNAQLINLFEISGTEIYKNIEATINSIDQGGSIDLNGDFTNIISANDTIANSVGGNNSLVIGATPTFSAGLTRLVVTGSSNISNWLTSDSVFLRNPNGGTNASVKLQGENRPTFDTDLQSNSAGGLYSKDRSTNLFPRSNAEQIARIIDVVEGKLDSKYEFDTTITFNTTSIDNSPFELVREVSYPQLLEVPFIAYLIDIKFNDDTELKVSTYDKELQIEDGYYGEVQSGVNVTTYPATPDVINLDSTKQTTDVSVGDGIPGAGITFSAETPGLINAIQTEKHIGATITLRLIFIREGKILAGPIRGGLLKIDGATHIVNPTSGTNLITLSTIKTWEDINQPHGIRTAAAYLESIFPNDGFFRNSKNANVNKTFKEE